MGTLYIPLSALPCTPVKSLRAQMNRSQVVRLARQLFPLSKPAATFAVMGNEMRDATA